MLADAMDYGSKGSTESCWVVSSQWLQKYIYVVSFCPLGAQKTQQLFHKFWIAFSFSIQKTCAINITLSEKYSVNPDSCWKCFLPYLNSSLNRSFPAKTDANE